MSYDIFLKDPVTREILYVEGDGMVEDVTEFWTSATYSYAAHFEKALGEGGVWSLSGKSGAESLPILKRAISRLKDDVSANYGVPTEGNAKKVLCMMLCMAQLRPDGVFEVD